MQGNKHFDDALTIIEIVVPLGLAALYVASTVSYIIYWDMGMRSLVFYGYIMCLFPLMLVLFLIASFLLHRLIQRGLRLQGFRLLTTYVLFMLLVFILLFAAFLYRYSDYPFKRITLTKTGGHSLQQMPHQLPVASMGIVRSPGQNAGDTGTDVAQRQVRGYELS